MLAGILAAAMGDTISPMTASGSFDASSTSGTVTSSTRTITVPAGNTGVFRFANYVDSGAIVATQYSRNGGAFTGITDGNTTAAFSNGDTLAIRTTGVGVGESRTLDLIDNTTNVVVESVFQNYA